MFFKWLQDRDPNITNAVAMADGLDSNTFAKSKANRHKWNEEKEIIGSNDQKIVDDKFRWHLVTRHYIVGAIEIRHQKRRGA